MIHRSIYNQESGIYQCSQITTANLNENSSGCECQSDSTIQGASGETEKRRRKTNRSRRNQRIGGGKNTKQKKNKKSGQVSSAMERVHSRA